MAGNWTLHWYGATGAVKLKSDGTYECTWCGLQFVGSWRVADGRVWITESFRPEAAGSWHHYSVPLHVASVGESPPEIRLERAR